MNQNAEEFENQPQEPGDVSLDELDEVAGGVGMGVTIQDLLQQKRCPICKSLMIRHPHHNNGSVYYTWKCGKCGTETNE